MKPTNPFGEKKDRCGQCGKDSPHGTIDYLGKLFGTNCKCWENYRGLLLAHGLLKERARENVRD